MWPSNMRVNGAGQSRGVVAKRVGKGSAGSAGGGFKVDSADSDATVQSAAPVASTANVGALLSIQEVPDAAEDRRRGIKRGRDLLAELDAIRVGLLSGRLPRERIERILRMLRQRQRGFDDPLLSEIVAQIEVRAAVELAKLEATEMADR